jgi:LysM repeat protein
MATTALAGDLLAPDHPERYVVRKGDTLWDIASRFLRNPWDWPFIWQVNPQVRNPHLIYPGDQLELVYEGGKPHLRLRRGESGLVKLSPEARVTPWGGAIPVVPIDAIAAFLSRPYVVDEKQLESAPYIVDFADEHIVAGAGQRAYVRSIDDTVETPNFDVVRPGDAYRDGDTGEVLGYEAQYVASVEVERTGDPATVFLSRAEIEALIGDRLLPVTEQPTVTDFYPKAPEREVKGSIISVLNGVSQIGQHAVVVLDRGAADGLSPGTVLRVFQRGETIRDLVSRNARERVTLPDEEAGLLLVFRTFERVSFGLIMHAKRAIHVMDRVRSPQHPTE